MIQLLFRCDSCSWRREGSTSGTLLDASDHATQFSHRVTIEGFATHTASTPALSASPTPMPTPTTPPSVRRSAIEAEIMRRARDKGLLGRHPWRTA
jgi:hypothetical protein